MKKEHRNKNFSWIQNYALEHLAKLNLMVRDKDDYWMFIFTTWKEYVRVYRETEKEQIAIFDSRGRSGISLNFLLL